MQQTLTKEKLAEVKKKLQHWLDDIQVLVIPTIMSSLFFGSRRSSAPFYNPFVAFKEIGLWAQKAQDAVKTNPTLSLLLQDAGRTAIEQLVRLTSAESLSAFKSNMPIKNIERLEYFLEYHTTIVRCVVDLKHRIDWLLENELKDT